MLLTVIKLHYRNIEYLGDSVYIAKSDHELIIFTSNNGYSAENIILFEPSVGLTLAKYLQKAGLKV